MKLTVSRQTLRHLTLDAAWQSRPLGPRPITYRCHQTPPKASFACTIKGAP